MSDRRRPAGHRDLLKVLPRPAWSNEIAVAPHQAGRRGRADGADPHRLPGQGRGADLARRRRRAGARRPADPHLRQRRRAPGQPVLPRALPGHGARRWPACVAREHTAQVDRRTTAGARGRVPRRRRCKLLYCSPTMELGVDIAEPQRRRDAQRPADPGQLRPALAAGPAVRPARAGHHLLRHRQRPRPVLLPPLRATWSPGRGRRPALDLANEDLVRSHVHAIWLAETG